eukprot:1786938-Pyramimonas_sp.AAC.1
MMPKRSRPWSSNSRAWESPCQNKCRVVAGRPPSGRGVPAHVSDSEAKCILNCFSTGTAGLRAIFA